MGIRTEIVPSYQTIKINIFVLLFQFTWCMGIKLITQINHILSASQHCLWIIEIFRRGKHKFPVEVDRTRTDNRNESDLNNFYNEDNNNKLAILFFLNAFNNTETISLHNTTVNEHYTFNWIFLRSTVRSI